MQKFLKQLHWEKALLARLTYVIRLIEAVLTPSFLAYVIEQKLPFLVAFVFSTFVLLLLMELRERLVEEVRTKERFVKSSYKDSG